MKKYFWKLSLLAAIPFAFSSCAPRAVVVRPVPPVMVRPGAPGPGHVWVDGEWYLQGRQYVYRQGYWATPRHGRSYWVPGHWKNTRHGSRWVPGYWR